MCAKRKGKVLSMRKVREVLRLAMVCNMGNREIARSFSVSHGTVGNYLRLAGHNGLIYRQIELMDDNELRRMLKDKSVVGPVESRPQPDWAWVHQEVKKKGVPLTLLWEEYRDIHPDGYQSTQFCELYRRYKRKLSPSIRQDHKAGERMFTDYAGQTVPIVDGRTRRYQTRSARIYAPSNILTVCPRSSSPITLKAAFPGPAATSRR